jgi:hypothetical protein
VTVGPGWPFLGLVAVGIAALVLAPGCGLLVVDEAPSGHVRLDAPALVELDSRVAGRSVAVASLSTTRARRQARRGLLRIRATGCDDVPTGSGFALGPTILLAHGDVLTGAGALKVGRRGGRAKTLRAARVFRLGELGVAQVTGRLPRALPVVGRAALGASVAVVGYPLSAAPRLIPGVVVDRVAGTRFGVRGSVMRLTSALGDDDVGGPVVDARGRIVGVAFTTDPRTGFAVAAPIRTLRSLVARGALEAVPPCDGA